MWNVDHVSKQLSTNATLAFQLAAHLASLAFTALADMAGMMHPFFFLFPQDSFLTLTLDSIRYGRMPSIEGILTAEPLNVTLRARISGSDARGNLLFSEGYEDAYASASQAGPHLVIIILTGFFAAMVAVAVVAGRLIARHQSRKHVTEISEAPVEVKVTEQISLAESGPTELESRVEANSGSCLSASSLFSPEPKYAYSNTTPILEAIPEMSEAQEVPALVVDELEDNDVMPASASGISIIPWSVLEGTYDENDGSENDSVEDFSSANGDSSSSFYSDGVLEEMSCIAADLKRLSFAKSIDIEVKSVDSERSPARLIEPELDEQLLTCAAESAKVCQSSSISDESFENALLDSEGMGEWKEHRLSRSYPTSITASPASSASVTVFKSPGIATEVGASDSLSGSPFSKLSPNTSRDYDKTLVSSSGSKFKSLTSFTSMVYGFGRSLLADDSVKHSVRNSSLFPLQAVSSDTPHELSPNLDPLQPKSDSDADVEKATLVEPFPARRVLANVQNLPRLP